jgi:nicotinamide-nucleotide amidase
LGPTFDDVTRDVWARVLRRPLRFRSDLLKTIRARFRQRGIPMPPANRRQAYLLAGARPLANDVGTAPGQRLDARDKTLFLFPGPGSELKPLVARELVPFLAGRGTPARRTRVWRLIGRPESAVDQRLRVLFRRPGVVGTTWGILAHDGVVDVKITARGDAPLAFWDGVLRREYGPDLFGEGAQSLAEALEIGLAARGETLAVAESCTGGLAAKQLTDVPGCSRVFWGGVVAYDNRAKIKLLGVPAALLERAGAVSAPVARAMAEGLRRARGRRPRAVGDRCGRTRGRIEGQACGARARGLGGPGGHAVLEKVIFGEPGGDPGTGRAVGVGRLAAGDYLGRTA